MKKSLQILILSLTGFCFFSGWSYSQPKIAVYHESWTGFPVNKIEFNNLTHIIHAFAWPDSNGSINTSYLIPDTALVNAVHRADKKILISFTNVDSLKGFEKIFSDSTVRVVFISNVIQFITANHYDGIDIDFEYPTASQSAPLTELVKEMRSAFNRINTTLLITMAIPPTSYFAQYFQLEEMLPYIDWYSALAYNFHGAFSVHTGHNAPLYASPIYPEGDDSSSVKYLTLNRNIPAAKLLLGIPFYGIEFHAKGLYKPLLNDTVKALLYSDIIDTVSSGKWNYNWDAVSKVPYYINGDSTVFISFDDSTSVSLKTKYSISNRLGGVMVWALGQDFVNGNQPLLESIGQTVRDNPAAVTPGWNPKQLSAKGFYLTDNYPNPFNPSTTISWNLTSGSFVTLKVYDILGNEVATLINEFQNAGVHTTTFNLQNIYDRNLSSGIYLYRIIAGKNVSVKKMMLMK